MAGPFPLAIFIKFKHSTKSLERLFIRQARRFSRKGIAIRFTVDTNFIEEFEGWLIAEYAAPHDGVPFFEAIERLIQQFLNGWTRLSASYRPAVDPAAADLAADHRCGARLAFCRPRTERPSFAHRALYRLRQNYGWDQHGSYRGAPAHCAAQHRCAAFRRRAGPWAPYGPPRSVHPRQKY